MRVVAGFGRTSRTVALSALVALSLAACGRAEVRVVTLDEPLSQGVLERIAATSSVSPKPWRHCRNVVAESNAVELVASGELDLDYTLVEPSSWPDDLLAAAKAYVGAHTGFEAMTLHSLELATEADGTRWAVFRAAVTDWPEYENAIVAMRQRPGRPWEGVNLGTGVSRAEDLPPALVAEGFGEGVYPD